MRRLVNPGAHRLSAPTLSQEAKSKFRVIDLISDRFLHVLIGIS
jgi:hypothetical protein